MIIRLIFAPVFKDISSGTTSAEIYVAMASSLLTSVMMATQTMTMDAHLHALSKKDSSAYLVLWESVPAVSFKGDNPLPNWIQPIRKEALM